MHKSIDDHHPKKITVYSKNFTTIHVVANNRTQKMFVVKIIVFQINDQGYALNIKDYIF